MVEKQLKMWFSGHLLNWHTNQNTRSMPWKGIKDPYRIWLSEVILQQTRVQQGLAYYQRFTKSFPDIHALAKADEKEVFKLWEGLGYYSRCRNLITTAKFISVELGGVFPETEEGLLTLKGVGKYTAAAIGSFAFGLQLAVVDGNVMRVLSRFLGIKDPIDQPSGKKQLEQLAHELLGKSDPASYNQAIMDLGATVCKPKNPDCAVCPLSKKCFALAGNIQDQFPVKAKKLIVAERFMYYLLLQSGQSFAIRQRKGKDIWQDLHEFILLEKDEPLEEEQLKRLSEWGIEASGEKLISISTLLKHQLTHQKINCRFVHIRIDKKIPIEAYYWATHQKIKSLAFPRLISRYLDSHFL